MKRLTLVLVTAFVFCLVMPAFAQEVKMEKHSSVKKLDKPTQDKLVKQAKDILTKQLKRERSKSLRVHEELRVVDKTAKGYRCDVISTFIHKETFTATMSKVEFEYDEKTGKGEVLSVDRNYVPPKQRGFREKPERTPSLADLLKKEKDKKKEPERDEAAPDDPEKFDIKKWGKKAKEADKKVKKEQHSWWLARGLSDTPCNEFPIAMDAAYWVWIYMYWNGNGTWPAALRRGNSCTESEITGFLRNDWRLHAWSHLGHGVTGYGHGLPCYGLVFKRGTMWWNEIYSWSWPAWGVLNSVCWVNSCNSASNPLRSAFLWRFPRTYIGGRILLPVHSSSIATAHFWYYTLITNKYIWHAKFLAEYGNGLIGAYRLDRYSGKF